MLEAMDAVASCMHKDNTKDDRVSRLRFAFGGKCSERFVGCFSAQYIVVWMRDPQKEK